MALFNPFANLYLLLIQIVVYLINGDAVVVVLYLYYLLFRCMIDVEVCCSCGCGEYLGLLCSGVCE